MLYHLLTFGCQMNIYDSQKIESIMSKSGHSPVCTPEEAEVILLNTCSIREKAENKVFSKLGRLAELKKTGGGKLIALGGCMASLRKEGLFRRAPMVDILFGPDNMERLPAMIADFVSTGARQAEADFADHTIWDGLGPIEGQVSAPVGIAKGCDNHCSYCIVPYTRGPEISRPADSVLAEVRSLASGGCREVILVGQNVNSYKGGGVDFPALLRLVENVDGIVRIRFMTSHPKDLGDELIGVMAGSKKICPSIHLPIQAGGDAVLSAMNRGYTAEEYLDKVARLKMAVPGAAISTDVMVGFPGETEDDFQKTMDVMREVEFDAIFLFNYSPRPGTPSANFEGVHSREVSQSRFDEANALHKTIMAKKLGGMVGTTHEALCLGPQTEFSGKKLHGRTPHNHLVVFDGDSKLKGETLKITITRVLGYNLFGVMAK
ncbi:MAG: tRNA (N6-isopentenyl adenosine(37)-C2)-methylthiotransferase MiaB [Nitrospinae bacterium]|nr:tRNA (N6-isopentenyl adenosine(37)-C2)-methylthiotransferase MiaB [Nitrospinota bacterium]